VQIGADRSWKSSGRIGAGREESSEQSIRPRNQLVRAINQAECCQSLLPMPGAAVLAGVEGPRVGLGSALAGLGNQRAWVSGVGAEERLHSSSRRSRAPITKRLIGDFDAMLCYLRFSARQTNVYTTGSTLLSAVIRNNFLQIEA